MKVDRWLRLLSALVVVNPILALYMAWPDLTGGEVQTGDGLVTLGVFLGAPVSLVLAVLLLLVLGSGVIEWGSFLGGAAWGCLAIGGMVSYLCALLFVLVRTSQVLKRMVLERREEFRW